MKLRPSATATLLALIVACALAPAALAQQPGGRLNLDSLDRLSTLAAQAKQRTEKTPDGKGTVYVREFEFARAGAYRDSDLDAVRAQLSAPGWSRFMKVEDRDADDPGEEETVEIYVYTRKVGRRVQGGMLIISAGARELTVVNVVGQAGVRELTERVRRGRE
jgi:hypothetical protein